MHTYKKEQMRMGDWVFRVYKTGEKRGQAYHIGYVVDERFNVVEAKGREVGVVANYLEEERGYWNAYGRPNYFEKEIESIPNSYGNFADEKSWEVDRLLMRENPPQSVEDIAGLQNAPPQLLFRE